MDPYETITALGVWGAVAWWALRRKSPPPPIRMPKAGFTHYEPDTELERWARAAAYSDQGARRFANLLALDMQLKPPTPPVRPLGVVTSARKPISFKAGEPQTFGEYEGQTQFLPFLMKEVRAMRGGRLSRPQLFIGPPGMGKTLLAKVIANEINQELKRRNEPEGEFILALGSDIEDIDALDQIIRRAAHWGNVLFVDEIHTLCSTKYIDKWLLLTDEHRWQFKGDADPTDLPDFTILAGTTDYGAIPGAFRRRFAERQMQLMTEGQIQSVLERRFQVAPAAAKLAAARTHFAGAPWEGIALLMEAETAARAAGRKDILSEDVNEVVQVWDLDTLGLRPHDRAAILALLRCPRVVRGRRKGDPDETIYVASADNVAAIARLDKAAYLEDIRPRLMSRGLVMTTSRGQQLTTEAVLKYGPRSV